MSANIAATAMHGSSFDLDDIPSRAEDYDFRVMPGSEAEYLLVTCNLEIVRLDQAADHAPLDGKQVYVLDTRNPLYSWWQSAAHHNRLTQADFIDGVCWFVAELLKAHPISPKKVMQ